jgi:hypothetical protein
VLQTAGQPGARVCDSGGGFDSACQSRFQSRGFHPGSFTDLNIQVRLLLCRVSSESCCGSKQMEYGHEIDIAGAADREVRVRVPETGA